MTSQEPLIHPPRLATWLVSLFAFAESEIILGDLQEEFSEFVFRVGIGSARGWYWRQALSTVARQLLVGFRLSPWSTVAAVVGGWLLDRYAWQLPTLVIFAVLHRYHIYENHFGGYLFFSTSGIAFGHVLASLFVGWMVGLASKRRELLATMILVLVFVGMTGASTLWLAARNAPILWSMFPWYIADWFAILIGGTIVRSHRVVSARQPST